MVNNEMKFDDKYQWDLSTILRQTAWGVYVTLL